MNITRTAIENLLYELSQRFEASLDMIEALQSKLDLAEARQEEAEANLAEALTEIYGLRNEY